MGVGRGGARIAVQAGALVGVAVGVGVRVGVGVFVGGLVGVLVGVEVGGVVGVGANTVTVDVSEQVLPGTSAPDGYLSLTSPETSALPEKAQSIQTE